MNHVAATFISIWKSLLLVVKFWFVSFYTLNLITPSGVLYTDGCQCENCECKG